MRIVTLSMYPPCPWISLIKNDVNSVKILSCKYNSSLKSTEALVEIISKDDNLKKLEEKLNNFNKKANFVRVNENHFIGTILSSKCPCLISGLVNYHIIDSYIDKKGKMNVSIMVSDDYPLKTLLENLRKMGIDVRLKRPSTSKNAYLTPKQKLVIKYAFEKGFFEYPKKVSIIDIGKELNLAPSTVSEMIRRGLRKLLKEYFEKQTFEKF